jgi:hypothetical protein
MDVDEAHSRIVVLSLYGLRSILVDNLVVSVVNARSFHSCGEVGHNRRESKVGGDCGPDVFV